MAGAQCVCVINKTTAVTIAPQPSLCVWGLYLNLQPSSRHCWAFLRTLAMPPLQPSTPLPGVTPPESRNKPRPPTPWAHIVLSVWRLPLLNNKLYFAAFKSNFLTFFNLNSNAWNGRHAHHHKYPQTQTHKRCCHWHTHIRTITQRNKISVFFFNLTTF